MERAFMLAPGQSRTESTLNILGDAVNVLLSGEDTGGGFCVMEDRTEPMAGPPLHRHWHEDEWFHVIEGEFRFEVDGETIHAGPGCSVYAARGTSHTFQNVGARTGRMLVVAQPSGLDLFFQDLCAAAAGDKPEPSLMLPVFEKYGLELLGPPLSARETFAVSTRA